MAHEQETEAALSLLSARAVRERAHEMLDAGLSDTLPHFRIDIAKLAPSADFVAGVIRENYPDLEVPLHARWRHFVTGGRDLWAETARKALWSDARARARAEFDLAIVSVLLDAGAGKDWRYDDAATGLRIGRSEGLAVASLRMFAAGAFSADPNDPLRADAGKLAALTSTDLARGFQANRDNPLTGLDGRAALLARLGRTLQAKPQVFARHDTARPGGLLDDLAESVNGQMLPTPALLHALLIHLAPIWPDRLTLGGVSLGDCWRHAAIKRRDATDGLMPLHKLSQWIAYSLIEPLQTAGIAVGDIEGLTGLAEYRNGGLLVDAGVLALRHPDQAARTHAVGAELVVEWRALTVALFDRLAPLVRERLSVAERDFPLGALLEGGTWAAGRKLAQIKRRDGGSPIQVTSDGTVF